MAQFDLVKYAHMIRTNENISAQKSVSWDTHEKCLCCIISGEALEAFPAEFIDFPRKYSKLECQDREAKSLKIPAFVNIYESINYK
jgi:hypothetical protein